MLLFSIILIVGGSISYLFHFETVAVWLLYPGIGLLIVSLYLIKFVRE